MSVGGKRQNWTTNDERGGALIENVGKIGR